MSRTAGLKKLSAIWASGIRGSLVNVVGHQNRVDVLAAAPIMRLPVALAAEAEAFVEGDRGVVVGKHVQLELADADLVRPLDGLLQQRSADAAPAEARRHHQAEVGHVTARGMGIPAEREPPDDATLRLRDEDRGVAVASERPEVAALVGHRSPAAIREQPA